MRVGVIARAEDRGLGNQCWEVARHLNPAKVLLVRPRPEGWPQRTERYAPFQTTQVTWKRGRLIDEATVRRWFDGLDVAYTAESVYDPRLPFWAADAGCTLVRHANPEQLGLEEIVEGDPTVWWSATPWRLEHLPIGTRVVPMPVALDRFPKPTPRTGLVRFLHSIGHAAQEDRAGTRCVAKAIRSARTRCELVVRCQDRQVEIPFRADRVEVTPLYRGVDNYWQAYADADVLVLPRRYGGLSLPSQEAMAAGLALVMTDCSPNELWPGPKVPVGARRTVHMRCGPVEVCDPDPHALTEIMDRLARDRDEVSRLQVEARLWAEANSWEALLPTWMAELERACRSSSPALEPASTGSGRGSG